MVEVIPTIDLALENEKQVHFPTTEAERNLYRTSDGKKLTAHQWAVYDLTRQIPCGKVTTYKHLCAKLGEGSPRSVGSALRKNPFAPFVPCHRIIASDLSLGGFVGEWGTENRKGSQCSRKIQMLAQEGVQFTTAGKLKDERQVVWN
ncbi:methylated-DNA--cysteine S-met [Fomitiporia mediterranea MF3/22]|uniref:methylated-DNA--cysteine S-met n=1 Tax=Fomitiporia mediterranea (strain MF3/22) TaxID=694068 RepID=UPI0004408858|nr:methylated-DNA--cysteine S-met [Fomitiporia mediterranea MF3/22]EJD00733.1 methylated-DNA--cysteine S-met [Fomitiporia mediterranea MF3/22]